MRSKTIWLATAAVLALAAPALADPLTRLPCTTDNTDNCFTPYVHSDGSFPGGSGGGSSGPVYGPTSEGTAPANPPIYNGFKDAGGLTRGVSPSTPFPSADQNLAPTVNAPGTAASKAQAVQNPDGTAIASAYPGIGNLTAIPTASTNGTALGAFPAKARGARIYLHPGDSISYTIQAAQPTGAPAAATVLTAAQPSSATSFTNIDENLASGEMVYVTATTGSPSFRWF